MIGIITAATQSGCILGYDLGDKNNKDQKIKILDHEGVFIDIRDIIKLNRNWKDDATKKVFKKLSRAVANDLSNQFDAQSDVNDNVKKTTGHIALSFSPLDREKLTDVMKVKIARDYMERMGIVDTQWVLIEHFDTNAPHMHIAYNRVKFDGSVINSKNERYRSQRISRELSEKYKLTPAGETERKRTSLHYEQQIYAKIRELALEALKCSLSFIEYDKYLADRGIYLQISRHSDGQIYGLSYSVYDGAFAAKGSKLDRKKLSFKGVMAAIQNNIKRYNQEYSSLESKEKIVQTSPQPVPQPRVKTVQELAKLKNVLTNVSTDKQSTIDDEKKKKNPGIKL